MRKKFFVGMVVGLFIAGGVLPVQAILIQDGEFTSWSSFSFVTDDPFVAGLPPNVSSGSVARVATGGNPGAFLQATHTFTTGDTIWTGGLKTDFIYTPAIDGAIASLSVSADLLHLRSGATAYQLVVEQGGQRYYSFPLEGFTQNPSWVSVAALNLDSTNFDTNPWAGISGIVADGNHPDFGPSADPLQFGFMFGNRVVGYGTLTNVLGLDNFSVSINPAAVPEPANVLLFSIGMVALVGNRIIRKKK